jgi:hypothetical protein
MVHRTTSTSETAPEANSSNKEEPIFKTDLTPTISNDINNFLKINPKLINGKSS